jgi:hypothetical protein
MTMTVEAWWILLRVVAVINIAAWFFAAVKLKDQPARRLQLILSGLYVFGCGFRCFLPVYDIPRMCLVDSWAASVLVGRSIATVAEVAFAAQWAVFLRGSKVSPTIVPLIVIAEICSWYAVLTTANLGHVFENSLWGICAAMIVASLVSMVPRCPASRRPVLAVWAVGGALYVAFIFLVDVPMYWSRWITDQANSREYLTLAQGIIDASACKVVSFRWEDWRNEVAWMTLYFSVGVWVSISLIFVDPPAKAKE